MEDSLYVLRLSADWKGRLKGGEPVDGAAPQYLCADWYLVGLLINQRELNFCSYRRFRIQVVLRVGASISDPSLPLMPFFVSRADHSPPLLPNDEKAILKCIVTRNGMRQQTP